nr:putative nucleotidyltransferase, ribonuclease H [Tanacetum cinerariifolium]
NNSWHASIKGVPFELLYGRKCRARICWKEVRERVIKGPESVEVMNEKAAIAKEKLKEAREPEAILDRQERVMRKKIVHLVKVLWKNHPERKATWENKEMMRTDYPHFYSRLDDMLRSCALEWTGIWDDYLCLVEFAYNNSWHASIKGVPFELLYGRKSRICWKEVRERVIKGPESVEVMNEKVAIAREKLKEARARQKSYADRHRSALEFKPRGLCVS